MLTPMQVKKIFLEEVNGQSPSVLGKEADAYRAEIRRDIALAKEQGGVLDYPAEWVDLGDEIEDSAQIANDAHRVAIEEGLTVAELEVLNAELGADTSAS